MIEIIKWIRDKKIIEEELDSQDKTIDTLKMQIAKLHHLKIENDYLKEQNDNYILSIKDLRKKVRFLNKREKKLQTIEMIEKNQPVDLKALHYAIIDEKNGDK